MTNDAAAYADNANPIVNGTEKQIAFARDLRARFIAGCNAQLELSQSPKHRALYSVNAVVKLGNLRSAAERISDSRFWLNNSYAVKSDFGRACTAVAEYGRCELNMCGLQ